MNWRSCFECAHEATPEDASAHFFKSQKRIYMSLFLFGLAQSSDGVNSFKRQDFTELPEGYIKL